MSSIDVQFLQVRAMLMMVRSETQTLLALLERWSAEHGPKTIDGLAPRAWFCEHLLGFLQAESNRLRKTHPAAADEIDAYIHETSQRSNMQN